MPVTSNIYERVFRLDVPGSDSGTGFVIEHRERQFLVTAAHLLPAQDPVTFQLRGRNAVWELSEAERLPGVIAGADIAVFELGEQFIPTFPAEPSMAGMMFTQDVFLLGYPFGRTAYLEGMGEFPFVKKGILSATTRTDSGALLLFIDAFNNPGFSGGPLAFYTADNQPKLAGVISGYLPDELPVLEGTGDPSGATVRANSGIVVAYSIAHAIDAIKENST